MEVETRRTSDAQVPGATSGAESSGNERRWRGRLVGETYGGADAPEVVRLRRENARLRQQLVAKERQREHLITRYEALLDDAYREVESTERADPGSSSGGSESRLARLCGWLPWSRDR